MLSGEEVQHIFLKFSFCAFLFFFYTGQAFALDSGTSTNGFINPGDTAYYSFTADAGQRVFLHGMGSFPVRIRVYKPDGSAWGSALYRTGGVVPATGTYNVTISSDGSTAGAFRLDYFKGGAGVSNGALTSGQRYMGDMQVNGIESFEFNGTAGQSVFLYTGASYQTSIYVLKPDGSVWDSAYNRLRANNLPQTGTYTVAVMGYATSNSGPYALDFVLSGGGVSKGSLRSGQSYAQRTKLLWISSKKWRG